MVLARLVRFGRLAMLYAGGRLIDRLRGRNSTWDRALRLRSVCLRVGGNALRVVEEVAQRIDLLPYEFYHAMSMTPEPATAMPQDGLLETMRRCTGRALEDDFEAFDPEPIVMDSVSCTYQAVLKDGDKVAVRVLRPGIRSVFAADIRALCLVLSVLELLTIIRPGALAHVREELAAMVAEDLDMRVMARHQRLLRRYARRDGPGWFTAARVYHAFDSADVLVTEFVSGIWLDEVIAAVHGENPEAEARIAELGIDLAQLGRRLLHASWWTAFECPFFQGAPKPTHIVVLPDNHIVFVNLRDCGATSARKRQLAAEVLKRMSDRDVSGAAESIVQLLSPLPFIDVSEFTKGLEARLWHRFFAMEDKRAPWVERTGLGVWLGVLEVAWEYDVPVRLDMVRMMRSFVLFESMAGPLRPKLDYFREHRRYRWEADRRAARRIRRTLRNTARRDGRVYVLARAREAARLVDRVRFFVSALTERVPVQFFSLTGKAAHAAAAVLEFLLTCGALTALLAAGLHVGEAMMGHPVVEGGLRGFVQTWPEIVVGALGLLLVITVRSILFRINDRESSS